MNIYAAQVTIYFPLYLCLRRAPVSVILEYSFKCVLDYRTLGLIFSTVCSRGITCIPKCQGTYRIFRIEFPDKECIIISTD